VDRSSQPTAPTAPAAAHQVMGSLPCADPPTFKANGVRHGWSSTSKGPWARATTVPPPNQPRESTVLHMRGKFRARGPGPVWVRVGKLPHSLAGRHSAVHGQVRSEAEAAASERRKTNPRLRRLRPACREGRGRSDNFASRLFMARRSCHFRGSELTHSRFRGSFRGTPQLTLTQFE